MNTSSTPWLNSFAGGEGQFQIKNGYGILVAARDLGSYITADAGHGIFHELWRDHEWLYVSKVEMGDGQVELEYLTLAESKGEVKLDNGRSNITEKRIVRNKIVFAADDKVLISAKSMARPKGSRLTVTTTYLEEELDD